MAKKKVNKSAAIRELLSADPKMPNKDIVSKLSGKGIKVQPSLVYMIRSQLGRKARKQRRLTAEAANRKSGGADPVGLILKVRSLAQEAGGMSNLKLLVDLLAE